MIKRYWPHNVNVLVSTPDKSLTTYQPGGVMIIASKKFYQRVGDRGKDPKGRWEWITLRGKNKTRTMIICAYAVSQKGRNYNLLTYAAQLQRLRDDNRPDLSIREIFWKDLEKFIQEKQEQNINVIVGMDDNSDCDNKKSEISKLIHNTVMIDSYEYLNTPFESILTYKYGKKLIDLIFMSKTLSPSIEKSLIFLFDEIEGKDNRGIICDIRSKYIKCNPESSTQLGSRILVTSSIKKMEKYISNLEDMIKKRKILERMNEIENSLSEQGINTQDIITFNKIDREITELQIKCEKKCGRGFTPVPCSPELSKCILKVFFLKNLKAP